MDVAMAETLCKSCWLLVTMNIRLVVEMLALPADDARPLPLVVHMRMTNAFSRLLVKTHAS